MMAILPAGAGMAVASISPRPACRCGPRYQVREDQLAPRIGVTGTDLAQCGPIRAGPCPEAARRAPTRDPSPECPGDWSAAADQSSQRPSVKMPEPAGGHLR